jgi:polyisoprenoid-binding protein YceI
MLRMILATVFLFSAITSEHGDTGRQYSIDTNHSSVGFPVSIMGGLSKVNGKFTDFDVNITNDEKDITKSSVSVVSKTASINTGITERDNHLRTADFFDVEKYPQIRFQRQRIEKRGKQLSAVGTFTMHGVTKEIALPFTVTGIKNDPVTKKMSTGYAARLTLNRRDFGVY